MSLADCEKCWSNPCTCGHDYRHWHNNKLYAQIVMLIRVLTINNSSPLQPIIDGIVAESHRQGIT